jgi:two-component system response regulator AtoC
VAQELVLDLFGRRLREIDVFGLYAPGEYEILLVDTSSRAAEEPLQRIREEFRRRNIDVRIGCAAYPHDGRNSDALVAKAHAGASVGPMVDDAGKLLVTEGAMQRLHQLVERIAAGMLSVLIVGETGVGKELLAATVHRLSPRTEKPFLRLNCAALSESLLETELFGHERGAFTGAVQSKPGLFETAQGGTVFLDELGEMPISTQVKLLRVIEERQVQRVGALKPRSIDVRFVAATNRDLELAIAQGSFRQDLYFRLNGITLTIPPLRQRTSEIPGLARVFAQAACRHIGRAEPPALSVETMKLLQQYSWPGNIRELRNVIERAVLLCGDEASITAEHLPVQKMKATFSTRMAIPPEVLALTRATAPSPPRATRAASDNEWTGQITLDGRDPPPPVAGSMRDEMDAVERRRILDALDQCAGNQTQAAKLLGISRRTLVNRLESYELPRPRKGRSR